MHNHKQIKTFVQDTLGCGCPEEVFNKIEYEEKQDRPWERRINTGDRLLVYIIRVDSENDVAGKMVTAMEAGITERNEKKFNRFRLVLISSNRDEIGPSAEKIFNASDLTDEKTHLHILSENDMQTLDSA